MQALYLNIGAQAHFRDDTGGTLHRLVVDPCTRQVTDLVILRGLLQKHAYVIPVSKVEHITTDDIFVGLGRQQLVEYPEYREIQREEQESDWDPEFVRPGEHQMFWNPMVGVIEWESKVMPVIRHSVATGILAQEEIIGRDSVIHNIDGVVGKVDHVWLDRGSWEITHLVVHRGRAHRHVAIPFAWVQQVTPQEIYVHGSNEQLGEVTTPTMNGDIMVHAPGGERPLDERLVVAGEILSALAADPRTAIAVFEVVFEGGVATLLGEVESQLIHTAAEEIVHRHPDVVSVTNALEVRARPWIDDVEYSVGAVLGQHLL
jgi:uncharacterized protein YrrD